MDLLSSNGHLHSYDNSTRITFPNTIQIHEHKAPTDQSIKLMEEAHDKAIKNIIAKVKVENNLVNGECFAMDQPYNLHDIKLFFKFKINDREFNVDREVSRYDIGWEDSKDICKLSGQLESFAKAFMLWYALKMFATVAFEQITGQRPPDILFK